MSEPSEIGGTCNICGSGVRYGSRHRTCGEAVMKLERDLAAMTAERNELATLKVCCGNFDTCTERCVPLVDHLRARERALREALQRYVDHFGDPLQCARAALAQQPEREG